MYYICKHKRTTYYEKEQTTVQVWQYLSRRGSSSHLPQKDFKDSYV